MKLSFSLKAKPVGAAPPLKPAAPFASLDDDTVDAAPTASSSSRTEVNKRLAVQSSSATSKATRKRLEEEKKVDQTVFEYDEVYDLMKQAEQRSKEKRDVEAQERKVRSILL
jgi:coiled-coil domain-containing protein 55